MWAAGVSEGLLWLTLDELGELRFSFVDVLASTKPYYMIRLLGGLLFLAGAVLMTYNLFKTVAGKKTVSVLPPAVQVAA